MDLREIDIDTLRDFRKMSLRRIAQVDKELDRRYNKALDRPAIDRATVTQLATREEVRPATIVNRCRRAGIPVTDKNGQPSRRGVTAFVSLNLYYEHYRHLTPTQPEEQ